MRMSSDASNEARLSGEKAPVGGLDGGQMPAGSEQVHTKGEQMHTDGERGEQTELPAVLAENYDFEADIRLAAVEGYAFSRGAFTPAICRAMEDEVAGLPMEPADHLSRPINAGKSHEVRQSHERYYTALTDDTVPVARFVAEAVHARAQSVVSDYPELAQLNLNEAGYQNYRNTSDMIGVHRDRRNDELLSVTITVNGSAQVLIHEPLDNPNDYKRTRVVDQFRTTPGSVMLLRAAGLASGEQSLHQVLAPDTGSRLILNLRMRPIIDSAGTPKVLEQPL